MIVAGIAMVFGLQIPILGGGVSGLWLAFIGWFLNSSAVASYRQVIVQDILEGVPVGRIMRSNPPSVLPGISADELVHDGVMGTDDHAFPVLDEEGELIGLVTLEDVRAIPRTSWDNTTVRQIMTPAEKLVSVTPEEDAAETLTLLQGHDVRQLPVMRNGSLAGLLRRRGIVKWLQLHSELG
jgi:CBS domain-containing protein